MKSQEFNRPSNTTAHDHILEIASDLFYAHGTRAVGVDTIIARSGVAKMTFYRHFGSKDQLITEIVEIRSLKWRNWFQSSVLESSKLPLDRLLAVFDVLEDKLTEKGFRGCAFINLIVELADKSHPACLAAANHKLLVQSFIKTLLEDAGYKDSSSLSEQLMILIDGVIVTCMRSDVASAVGAARRAAKKILSVD